MAGQPGIRGNHAAGMAFEARVVAFIKKAGWQSWRMPGSGAFAALKSDIAANIGKYSFLLEAKKSRGESIGLCKEFFDKNKKEARDIGKIPAVTFGFNKSPIYIAVELEFFIELIEKLNQVGKGEGCCHDQAVQSMKDSQLPIVLQADPNKAMSINIDESITVSEIPGSKNGVSIGVVLKKEPEPEKKPEAKPTLEDDWDDK
jgi:Holliday junction resolvase